jgi:glycerophosphoryl diester phosphodiesterase
LHDATLERTTDGSQRADSRTWRELAQLDAGSWHSPGFAGEPLATLRNVARYVRANGIAVNVEIKPTPGREREIGAAVALDAATFWAGAGVAPLLSSFSEAALEAAREVAPALPRAWLCDRAVADWRERCAALRCIAFDVDHNLVDAELVAAVHAAGLRLMAWTVNEPARALELAAWGVDSIITDAIDLIPPE